MSSMPIEAAAAQSVGHHENPLILTANRTLTLNDQLPINVEARLMRENEGSADFTPEEAAEMEAHKAEMARQDAWQGTGKDELLKAQGKMIHAQLIFIADNNIESYAKAQTEFIASQNRALNLLGVI